MSASSATAPSSATDVPSVGVDPSEAASISDVLLSQAQPSGGGAKSQGAVTEGLAAIAGGVLDANNVFYNPVQVFNRDLSLVAIRAFADIRFHEGQASKKRSASGASASTDGRVKLRVLEPLAATGLRSIRYALELSDVIGLVVAGDLDSTAVRTIDENKRRNKVPNSLLRTVCADANQLMYACHFGGVEASEAFSLANEDVPAVDAKSMTCSSLTNERSHQTASVSFAPKPPSQSKANYFDIIDLDPYGSVAGFLDAAVQAVAEGGLLCLTSTDMPILCGNNPEVSFYKYGGTALKSRYMHEMSLRLLMNALAMSAARYKKVIEPLACCSVDFYVRCFVRVHSSPAGCKTLPSKTALVFQCKACDSFSICPLGITVSKEEGKGYKFKPPVAPLQDMNSCQQCGNQGLWIGGPFYKGPLYCREFLDRCLHFLEPNNEENYPFVKHLTMTPKIRGLLTAMTEELVEVPLFYSLPALMNRVKTETMKLVQFKSALLHLGYTVSHFHREPQSIKTNAPDYVVFDIIRKWAKEHPPKNPEKYSILSKPFTLPEGSISFDVHPDALKKSAVCISKWLPNPTPYWGPKARAKPSGSRQGEEDTKKRHIEQ